MPLQTKGKPVSLATVGLVVEMVLVLADTNERELLGFQSGSDLIGGLWL
jgi:hypothetical protein